MTERPIWCQPRDSQLGPRLRYTYGTRKSFKVVPVRQKDKRWIMTPDHRAQAWAIAQFQRGHSVKLVRRFATKAEAEAHLHSAQRAVEGPAKSYRLGARMGPKSAGKNS